MKESGGIPKHKILILLPLLMCFCFCSKKEDVLFDFTGDLPQATVVRPYRNVNLFRSWKESDRDFGWNKNKKHEKNAILIPARKEKAVYRFGCLQREDKRVVLSLKSLLAREGKEPPVLDIFLNGYEVFSAPLDWHRYRKISFRAGKEQFRIGENFLEFRRSGLPPDTTSKHWLALRKFMIGGKSKAVVVKERAEDRVAAVTEKNLFGTRRGLSLSPNTAVNFYLKLDQPAVLDFDVDTGEMYADFPGKSRLFIHLETPEGETRTLFGQTLKEGRGINKDAMPISLSSFRNEMLQLSFVFMADRGDDGAEKKLVILNPRVLGLDQSPPADKEPEPGISRPFNILIYLVDCLRPDHLPFFGYAKNTAPRMTEFSRDCILFKNAYAQASWTRPSVGALFTGLYPFQHQAVTLKSGLAAELQTLAEILKAENFHTIGVSSNAGIKRFFNFNQGFDYFKYHSNLDGGQAAALNTYAFAQLRKKPSPFFLYIHTMEPHRPYKLKPEFIPGAPGEKKIVSVVRGEKEKYSVDLNEVVSNYDASIRQNDQAFGELMDEMKSLDLYDRTLIILMSDHGEEFYEHGGFAHGQKLYQESIKHLFIVKLPQQKNAGTVVEENVQEIDIFPTLLDMAGLAVPAYCAGKSLKPILLSPGSVSPPFHSEIFLETANELHKKAVIDGHWKLIHNGSDWSEDIREYELYNLHADPGEETDLYGHNAVAARYLTRRLRGWAGAQKKLAGLGKEDIEKVLTQEEIDEFKALGYIK